MAAMTAGRRGNEISSKEAPVMSSGTWSLINASPKVRMLPFLFLQTFIIVLFLLLDWCCQHWSSLEKKATSTICRCGITTLEQMGHMHDPRSCSTSSEMHRFGDKQRCPPRGRMIYQATAAQPPSWIRSLALQPAGISLIPHFHQAVLSPGAESWPCSKPLSQGQGGEGRQSNRPPAEPLYCTC